tara:strand:+ start:227 stop:1270 length:1044 start_codon:yes stop_codon:yes gene_type:complete
VQLIIKKLLIIFLIYIPFKFNLHSSEVDINDFGIIAIMYHRFEENKYPSTNIKVEDFKKHIEMMRGSDIKFVNPSNFKEELVNNKKERKVLLTIDDGYQSFYENAWPILKKSKIPFILFVSTREVGKNGYMSWDDIREIEKYDFVEIGNHSHSHDYLIDFVDQEIENDLKKSIDIFKKELGKNSIFFSYPFGEYSSNLKNIVIDLGFKYAFGQHSGVTDLTKNLFEMPRFPINEKYGEIERFKTILKTLPFPYKSIQPVERYISDKNNPPQVNIQFYDNLQNLNNINCFSNEENKWRNSKIILDSKYNLKINLDGKFTTERGRINCSLREKNGFYRWLGIQFVVKEK